MNAEFGFNAKNYPHSHVFSKKILTPTKVVTLEFGRGLNSKMLSILALGING